MRLRILFVASVIGLAFLALGASSALASQTTATVSGTVTLAPGLSLQVTAAASGTSASSLSGQGIDSTFHGNPGGPPPGTCGFPLTGSVSGGVVTLSGAVTRSTNPSLVGIPVTVIGDASTGAITFLFDGFTLTGTGTVVIN